MPANDIGNVDIAILTKLNELVERFGLSPLDVSADFHREGHGKSQLTFYTLPQEGVPFAKFERMLEALGLTDRESLEITGTEQQIYDTLLWALQKAPKPPRWER